MRDRKITATDGTVLDTKKVSPVAIQLMQRRHLAKKPRMPMIEVLVPGTVDKTRMEANPNDPAYIDALAEWESNGQIEVMQYVFVGGVIQNPPAEFVEETREFFPEADDKDMKFMWVSSLFPSDTETERLVAFILGQNIATEGGIAQAEERFPSGGEPAPDPSVAVQA